MVKARLRCSCVTSQMLYQVFFSYLLSPYSPPTLPLLSPSSPLLSPSSLAPPHSILGLFEHTPMVYINNMYVRRFFDIFFYLIHLVCFNLIFLFYIYFNYLIYIYIYISPFFGFYLICFIVFKFCTYFYNLV